MTDIPLPPLVPIGIGVDVIDELVISEVSALLEGDLADLSAANTVDEAIANAEKIRAELGLKMNTRQLPIGTNIIDTLSQAYRTGEVLPEQTIEAMQYAFTAAGPLIVRPDGIHGHTLAAELKRYAAHVHNRTHPPVKLPGDGSHLVIKHPTPIVAVGVRVPEPNSPGGKIVTAAEAKILTARITVPGLSAAEAKGISLAIARAYEDTLVVVVDALNHVEAQITTITSDLLAQGHRAGTVTRLVAKTAPGVTHALSEIRTAIAGIVGTDRHLATQIRGLQRQITAISSQPKTTTLPLPPVGAPGITPGERSLIATIPLLATTASVTQVSLLANTAEALALKNQATLGDSYVPNLPSKIATLEACCAANSGITNPIRAGGATPSLLGSLGGLLAKVGMLTIGAGILETVIALFDMPDVILGEVKSMQWVRPIAEAAARGALADTQWSKQLNPGTP